MRFDGVSSLHLPTIESFGNLVEVCKGHIWSHGLTLSSTGQPQPCHLSCRIVKPRDVVAIALRFFLSAEVVKDLHSQFGVVATSFINAVQLGIISLKSLWLMRRGIG